MSQARLMEGTSLARRIAGGDRQTGGRPHRTDRHGTVPRDGSDRRGPGVTYVRMKQKGCHTGGDDPQHGRTVLARQRGEQAEQVARGDLFGGCELLQLINEDDVPRPLSTVEDDAAQLGGHITGGLQEPGSSSAFTSRPTSPSRGSRTPIRPRASTAAARPPGTGRSSDTLIPSARIRGSTPAHGGRLPAPRGPSAAGRAPPPHRLAVEPLGHPCLGVLRSVAVGRREADLDAVPQTASGQRQRWARGASRHFGVCMASSGGGQCLNHGYGWWRCARSSGLLSQGRYAAADRAGDRVQDRPFPLRSGGVDGPIRDAPGRPAGRLRGE